jgi:hypothetical protein
MKNFSTQLIGSLAVLFILSGCYTQLEVVERPVYVHDRYERPAPARAYNNSDPKRMDEHAAQNEYFDDESYEVGYDDGFSDALTFRSYSHQSAIGLDDYNLGYYEGYEAARWDYKRYRYRYGHTAYYWDPFYYDSFWSFHVSWRHHHPYYAYGFHYGYHNPYAFYGYHRYPVYYGGYHGGYYGGYYGGNTWIVYNNNVINNSNVNRGPRNSGVNRDFALNTTTRATTRNANSTNQSGRNSGVDRQTTTTSRGVANTERTTRSTATQPRTNSGRSSGVQSGRTNQGGSSSGTVRSGSRSGSSSGTTTTSRPRGNSSSGTVGSRSSGGSSSSGSSPRKRNRGGNDESFSAASTTAPAQNTRTVNTKRSIINASPYARTVRNQSDAPGRDVRATAPTRTISAAQQRNPNQYRTTTPSAFERASSSFDNRERQSSVRTHNTATSNTISTQRPATTAATQRNVTNTSQRSVPSAARSSNTSNNNQATTSRSTSSSSNTDSSTRSRARGN